MALVEGAKRLGFEVVARTQTGLLLRMLGTEVLVDILNVLEYSSARARMSVIARAPDGTVRLYCKGSDTKIMDMLRPDSPPGLLDTANRNLHSFATRVRNFPLPAWSLPHGGVPSSAPGCCGSMWPA